MSITFQLDHDYTVIAPWSGKPASYEPSEAELDAYFGALANWGEFNVANGNGRYILKDLLGIDPSEEYGTLSYDEFQFRLSLIDPMAVVGGLEPSEEFVGAGGATMHLCGRSIDQCERYVACLVRLGRLAQAYKCGIQWG